MMQIQKSTVLSEGSLPHYRKVDGPNLPHYRKVNSPRMSPHYGKVLLRLLTRTEAIITDLSGRAGAEQGRPLQIDAAWANVEEIPRASIVSKPSHSVWQVPSGRLAPRAAGVRAIARGSRNTNNRANLGSSNYNYLGISEYAL